MVILKKRQIISLSLLAMIAISLYLQCSNKEKVNVISNDDTYGQKVYVNATVEEKNKCDFFAKTKLDRDIVRGQNKEILEEISLDKNATEEVKNSAYKQMLKIVSDKEKEDKIETMVKEMGFNNVIAILGDNDCLDIIVKAPELTANSATQIANIGKRYANINISDIHVKCKE